MFTLVMLMTPMQLPDVVIEGALPLSVDRFYDVAFDVPAGVAEIEIHQSSLDDRDVLDFSLHDADGTFRGEGGGRLHTVVINAAAATRSYLPGLVDARRFIVSIGAARLQSPTPWYRVEVLFRSEVTLIATVRTPYVASAPLDVRARFYAGDFHVHSEDSNDARPPLDEIVQFAQSRGLDFCVVTDHNTSAHIERIVPAQQRVSGAPLLLIPGVEFTTYAGHATGFAATQPVDWRLGHNDATLKKAVQAFKDQGALLSINHPALNLGDACIGCAWTQEIPSHDLAAVEVATNGYLPTGRFFFEDALLFWEGLLDSGMHLAALGGSDDHQAGQDSTAIGDPTTLVFADNLSVEAIAQGVLASRTVVKLQGPGDPMIDLQTAPARNSGDHLDTVAFHDKVTVSATVTAGIGNQFAFVQEGEYALSEDITRDPQTFSVDITPPASGEVRVRAEVDDGDVPRTVTSYVWIKSAPPPSGCGCGAVEGALGVLPIALVTLTRRRRRRASQP